jgi:PAS domain S-box-containing protein
MPASAVSGRNSPMSEPQQKGRSQLLIYGAVGAATVIATFLRLALTPLIGPTSVPFITFFPAVLFSAWYGGFRAGLLSILLSVVIADYFFVSPVGAFYPFSPGDGMALVTFVVVGLGIALLSHSQRRALERADQELILRRTAERELLRSHEELEQRVQERTDQLSHSEQRFRLMVEGVEDYAIYMLSPEGNIVTWNAGAQNLKGYTAQEVIGKHLSLFYTPEDVAAGIPQRQLVEAANQGKAAREGWRVRKGGVRFWAMTTLTALRDPEGQLIGFSKITRDLTERRQAEEALRHKAAELARSNAELEQFAYVSSHDLQEPLRMVTAFMRKLESEYGEKLDSDAREYIGYAVQGASRMKQLIKDLLTLSRVGTRSQEISATDCSAVLQGVLTNLEVAAKESGAEITCDPLPTVMSDRTQTGQLLQNLISNALTFRNQSVPRIHISAKRQGEEWVFSVSDNGIGISPEQHERIFMMFERLHDRTEYPGTGIGLAVCKKIVERHGGRIWVQSAPGEGSTFYFTLPAKDLELGRERDVEHSGSTD